MRELSDGRGNLEALAEDDLLALKANILGPLDKAGEVLDGLDVLACERPKTHINIRCKIYRKTNGDSPIPKFFGRDSKRGFF